MPAESSMLKLSRLGSMDDSVIGLWSRGALTWRLQVPFNEGFELRFGQLPDVGSNYRAAFEQH